MLRGVKVTDAASVHPIVLAHFKWQLSLQPVIIITIDWIYKPATWFTSDGRLPAYYREQSRGRSNSKKHPDCGRHFYHWRS